MNVGKLVDSNQRKLQTPEIMMIAANATKSKYDPQTILATIMTELGEKKSIGVQNGNTLFLISPAPDQPGSAFFRALNADIPQNFFQNCLTFIKLAQGEGYNTLVTQFEDESIAKMLKLVQAKGQGWYEPSTQMDLQQNAEGTYQATIYTDQSFLSRGDAWAQ